VLIFSKTTGFRHASIPDGIAAIQSLGAENDFEVDASEDANVFVDANLAQYQAVVFLSTTGDILDGNQQAAFERYIQAGGGFVGIHSAADTEYDWPWYGGLIGAYFLSHPQIQTATIKVADRVHPSTSMLPKRWVRNDEWYNFRANPRGKVHVLATLDESTYTGGTNAPDHPIAWCHEYDGGRAWYTAGGHTNESYSEALFLAHLLGGIEFAAGAKPADCGATLDRYFQRTILDDNPDSPTELAVAPDGRVFYLELGGTVKVYKPETGSIVVAGQLEVFRNFEDGLLGITLDPDFVSNHWLYLFYSPAGAAPKQNVSRFTVVGDALDMQSEKILLEIPVQREQCCHSAGSLAFGPDGNLYIAAGDNTNPFASDGYAPIDERPGRSAWDAQKSSSNTNDLRGKVLRITPQADGTYTIPDGNLFPKDGSTGRPEIYAMGMRNPYRISIDAKTGWLYWGDVGPDAQIPNANRGPQGLDEWNQARGPGYFGWPYFIGNNQAYRDFDFATGVSGDYFDYNAPVNNSPNNTGSQQLPPAQPAWIWYPYGPSQEFPELATGGRTAMAGPVYHFDPNLQSERKLPAYYDETLFIYEWSRNWIMEVKLDDEGDILEINPFLPSFEFRAPIDMEIGPDGAIYMLEWGIGFGFNNPDARLTRIDYVAGNRAPIVKAKATPSSGSVPLTVQFSSEGSFDPDPDDTITLAWSFKGDSTINSTEPNPQFTYVDAGDYVAQLTVTDSEGKSAVANVPITAGNNAPVVTITEPVSGGFFGWGDSIRYQINVTDAEDGSTNNGGIACEEVVLQPFLGHDEHGHPLDQYHGCDGVFVTASGHGSGGDNVFYVVSAAYTDKGAPPAGSLTGKAEHLLQPKRKQAEHFLSQSGIQLETTGDWAGGGQNIGYVEHGDYVSYQPMNLQNINFITYRVASQGPGGRIEVHVDAPDGNLISTAIVEPTGAWQTYRDVTTTILDPGGTHELFFVFLRNPGDVGLFNVNWMDFHGAGISVVSPGAPDGLQATYYDNADLTRPSVTRKDPMINFNWGEGPPDPAIGNDTFSVRWTGWVEAQFNQSYRFYTRSDDGVRLWVNNNLIIDKWIDQPVTEWSSAAVALRRGVRYPIKMEFYDNSGTAQVDLLWSSPSTRKTTVPANVLFTTDRPTAVEDVKSSKLPQRLHLHQAYPNPFNPSTRIVYELPSNEHVRLELFNVLGQRVRVLIDEVKPAGVHAIILDATGLPSGTYIYRLSASQQSLTRRIVFLR
jgi:glucose/arabinose dehydrogenase